MSNILKDKVPKFYGSVTVGERGQVAIPAEARRDLGIGPATKLLAFGGQDKNVVMFVKAEAISEFIASATAILSQLQQTLASSAADSDHETD